MKIREIMKRIKLNQQKLDKYRETKRLKKLALRKLLGSPVPSVILPTERVYALPIVINPVPTLTAKEKKKLPKQKKIGIKRTINVMAKKTKISIPPVVEKKIKELNPNKRPLIINNFETNLLPNTRDNLKYNLRQKEIIYYPWPKEKKNPKFFKKNIEIEKTLVHNLKLCDINTFFNEPLTKEAKAVLRQFEHVDYAYKTKPGFYDFEFQKFGITHKDLVHKNKLSEDYKFKHKELFKKIKNEIQLPLLYSKLDPKVYKVSYYNIFTHEDDNIINE